jgi:hypothetical protein
MICNCLTCDDCIKRIFAPIPAKVSLNDVLKVTSKTGELEAENFLTTQHLPYCRRKGCTKKSLGNNPYGFCPDCFEELI